MKYVEDVVLTALMAPFMALLIYGFVHFPDAPIQACGTDQFCGKAHKLHSKEEYNAFFVWEQQFVLSIPIAFAAGFALYEHRRRRKAAAWARLRRLMPTMSPALEEQRYAAAWKDLRRRELISGALFFSPLILLASATFFLDSIPQGWGLLPLSPFALFPVALLWQLNFSCPRCGSRHSLTKHFRKRKQQCVCCGLRRGATFGEALADLKDR